MSKNSLGKEANKLGQSAGQRAKPKWYLQKDYRG